MQTPVRLKSFSELKVRTPRKNYSLINRGPELNIPPRAPFQQKVIKQRAWISELKRKYGLRRKHLPSRLSVPGLAGATAGIRQPADLIGGTTSNGLASHTRSGPGDVGSTGGGLGRNVKMYSNKADQSLGGIIPPSTRRRKR